MKASELRIGNFIADYEAEPNKTIYWQVETIEHLNNTLGVRFRNGSCWACEEAIEPIPLTEEWLLKFGFEKSTFGSSTMFFSNNDSFGYIQEQAYRCNDNYGYCLNDEKMWFLEIKYVHQLQNLYFALIGEELTLEKL